MHEEAHRDEEMKTRDDDSCQLLTHSKKTPTTKTSVAYHYHSLLKSF
jgi:hypothetical protein